MDKIDFKLLGSQLLGNAISNLQAWLPGGRSYHGEYEVGSLQGEPGKSLKINIESGVWKDFATGEGGADLISLYAAIKCLGQAEAARQLSGVHILGLPNLTELVKKKEKPPIKFIYPGKDVKRPDFNHLLHGKPTEIYEYKSKEGRLINYVCRYDKKDGGKHFNPFSYTEQGWVKKQLNKPRPLYNLDKLINDTVLVVEGEKSVHAAEKLFPLTVSVVTWAGGSSSILYNRWEPLYNKNIIIWPDADVPGRKAAAKLSEFLFNHCPTIKIIDIPELDGGEDAADFIGVTEELLSKAISVKPRPAIIPEVIPDNKPIIYDEPHEQVDELEGMLEGVSAELQVLWKGFKLDANKSGMPIANTCNAGKVMEGINNLKGEFWYDEFYRHKLTKWRTKGETLQLQDHHVIGFQNYLQGEFKLTNFNERVIGPAIDLYMKNNIKNEPKEWMDSLKWDGTKRLPVFFTSYMGADASEYTQAVSKNFWISMVARIMRPGCKVDNMVVIEGPQGAFKSSALKLIAGEKWFTESTDSFGRGNDFYYVISGKILVEFSELSSFSKAGVNTIKKILSTASDRIRKPYDRNASDDQRTCVFVGTTNDDSYLRDATGGRRFWPIKAGKIVLKEIEKDRDQLFAEAVHRYKAGEQWHEVPETAKEIQESRREMDDWQELISDWILSQGQRKYKTHDILMGALDMDKDKINRSVSLRVVAIMKILNYTLKPVRDKITKIPTKVWVKDEL